MKKHLVKCWKSLTPILFLVAFNCLYCFGQAFPPVSPEDAGMSSQRLNSIDQVLQKHVDEEKIPGAVVLILRNGKAVYQKSFGYLDLEERREMGPDAIFRIASQTKALTSVAIMMLHEEGKILLSDPLSKFIPEYAETRVAFETGESGGHTIEPAEREIRIRDLLTHTAGISYGYGHPLEEEYQAIDLHGWYFADQNRPIEKAILKLAELPFSAHPGQKFVYGFSTDILGHVVERISGLSLAEFFESRITKPLKMNDTHFYLPKEKLPRLTAVYGLQENGEIELVERASESEYVTGPAVSYSGGAGLLATASDYARFLQMLLNGGELDGVRILSPKSVQLMTVNHVGDLYGDRGFGLGFWVTEDLGQSGELGSVGAFGWGGAYYTSYWVDPAERLVAVFMTQMLPKGSLDLQGKLEALVYQAINDSYVD